MNEEIKAKAEEAIKQYEFFEQQVLTSEQRRIFKIAFKFGYEKAQQEAQLEASKVSRWYSPERGDSSGLSYCKICRGHDYSCKCELPNKMLVKDLEKAKEEYNNRG